MTDLSRLAHQPRIVVIGLGVVGAALADELTQRGMRHVTVLEQGPLWETGGSSSHAPGFVFQTSPHRTMSLLARRTLDKLDGQKVDGQWLLKRLGGLEIATTPERLHDLYRRHGLAQSWGIPSRLVDPGECTELWPGLDTTSVLGGFHTPTDGVVKSVHAVRWQAERAVEHGARLLPRTRVVGVTRSGGRVTGVEVLPVPAPDGATPEHVPADVVVACAGLWGPGLARDLLGFELPMMPMEHCFGLSAPVPGLIGRHDVLDEASRPMLRHQDFSLYLREYVDRIGIGAYRHRPMPVEPDAVASADEFAATGVHPAMHPLTWEEFGPSWDEARRLLPELRDAGFGEGFNGIFSFTPDGGPMLGPVAGIDGLWLAQAVWVTQSAGVGQVMADWIVRDDPGVDTHGLEYTRFDPAVVSRDWTRARAAEAYAEVYDVVHPQASTEVQRGLRTSPFHDRQRELGAVFEQANGWERPLWFEANAPLVDALDRVPERDAWAARHWSPIAAAEAHATRTAAGLYDMTPLSRLEVSGPGATAFLQHLTSNDVDRAVGRVVYALLLDDAGGIRSDVTVTRLGPEQYLVGTNGHRDRVHLESRCPDTVRITDLTAGTCGLGLWGPRARDVLERLTDDDVSHQALGYFRAKRLRVAGTDVLALRVSYVGELGWELWTTADQGRRLWDSLREAGTPSGLVAGGRRAFHSLRLEKGYRAYGTDIGREHSPAEAGLGLAVSSRKGDFVGRAALEDRPVRRRLACLTLDAPDAVVLGSEPVLARGAGPGQGAVGYVTSADQSYTLGVTVAYAWLPPELAEPGTALDVEYFGRRLPATVQSEPLVDPEMSRILR